MFEPIERWLCFFAVERLCSIKELFFLRSLHESLQVLCDRN